MKPAVLPAPTFAGGFTLIELAIVLFVVALLLGGMLLPLSAQQDVRSYGDTQKILTEARDALVGFAMANGRLPCPAKSGTTGVESLTSPGVCSNPYDGYFPAATLGFTPVDADGYLLDGWGGDATHRVRYAVSTANSNAFTTQNGMKTIGMTTLAPDLEICNSGAQIRDPPITTAPDTADKYCHPSYRLSQDAVAVVYSLGKNSGSGGTTTDELPNVTTDVVFVSAPQGPDFDDQVLWLSKSTLFNRMVTAGQLP